MNIRLAFTVILVCLTILTTQSSADIVMFSVSGTADVTVNGNFHVAEQYNILFSIDDSEVDRIGESRRGGFRNVTTLLSFDDPTLMIDQQLALNVNGLRQDATPEAIFLANDSDFFDPAFSILLDSSVIVDVNQINPLSLPEVSAKSSGANVIWDLGGGRTVQFNQVNSITLSNAIPEPSSLALMIVGVLAGLSFRRSRNRIR